MTSTANFTSIDLNAAETTPIYDPINRKVTGVYMKNEGTTAETELQVTDGSTTATLAIPGAGNSLEFSGEVHLDKDHSLQIEVTTKEGSSETGTAVVFSGD